MGNVDLDHPLYWHHHTENRGNQADWGQLARTLGFAESPGVLKVVGFIPVIGPLIFFIASIWQLVAMIVAIKVALEYES